MKDVESKLLAGWEIPIPYLVHYLGFVVMGAFLVRFALTFLWTLEESSKRRWPEREVLSRDIFWSRFLSRRAFGGSDYWHPFVLGFLELLVAPVLIFSGAWLLIGGWLTLKTVAQWDAWKTSRHTFNGFLIGNALVLIWAYWMARCFVKNVPPHLV